jgi:hypothetical protein
MSTKRIYRSTAVRQDPLCVLLLDFRPAFKHSGQVLNEFKKGLTHSGRRFIAVSLLRWFCTYLNSLHNSSFLNTADKTYSYSSGVITWTCLLSGVIGAPRASQELLANTYLWWRSRQPHLTSGRQSTASCWESMLKFYNPQIYDLYVDSRPNLVPYLSRIYKSAVTACHESRGWRPQAHLHVANYPALACMNRITLLNKFFGHVLPQVCIILADITFWKKKKSRES